MAAKTSPQKKRRRATIKRGTAARNKLVLANQGLVHHVVKIYERQYTGAALPWDTDDLTQWGQLGLIHAAERWDKARGITLSTYAFRCIHGQILNGMRGADMARWRAGGDAVIFQVDFSGAAISVDAGQATRLQRRVIADTADHDAVDRTEMMLDAGRVLSRLGSLAPSDRDLVDRIAILGESVAEVAKARGVTRTVIRSELERIVEEHSEGDPHG